MNFCSLVLRPHWIAGYHYQSTTKTNNFMSSRNLKLSSPVSCGCIVLGLLRWQPGSQLHFVDGAFTGPPLRNSPGFNTSSCYSLSLSGTLRDLLPTQQPVNKTFRKFVFLRTLSLSSFMIFVSLEPEEKVPDRLQKAAGNVAFKVAKATRGSGGELFSHREVFLYVC